MSKFLITPRSHNRLVGPIMVTTSPRKTCPASCPLRKSAATEKAGVCYAEHGFLGGFIWSKLDQLPVGGSFKSGQIKVRSRDELLAAIRSQPEGAIWRHNQAGDLAADAAGTIDQEELDQIIAANRGRRGFTYTHHDMLGNEANRKAVARANANGFTINLSADNLTEADQLAALAIAPVTVVVPTENRKNFVSPDGNQVVICPAQVRTDMTCATCKICAKQRKAIVAFPALGASAVRVKAA